MSFERYTNMDNVMNFYSSACHCLASALNQMTPVSLAFEKKTKI